MAKRWRRLRPLTGGAVAGRVCVVAGRRPTAAGAASTHSGSSNMPVDGRVAGAHAATTCKAGQRLLVLAPDQIQPEATERKPVVARAAGAEQSTIECSCWELERQ